MLRLFSVTAICVLTACGSETLEVRTPQEIIAFQICAAAGDAMVTELQSLAPTAFARMPTTGSAEYNGYTGMKIDPVVRITADDILLFGDATVNVQFDGAGKVTGRVDNIGAIPVTGIGQSFETVAGAIIIWTASSGIGGSQTANQWGANYEGTLSLPGETYEVSGSLDGIFLGNRTSSPLPEDIVKR